MGSQLRSEQLFISHKVTGPEYDLVIADGQTVFESAVFGHERAKIVTLPGLQCGEAK